MTCSHEHLTRRAPRVRCGACQGSDEFARKLERELIASNRDNAKLRQLIEECRPYVLNSPAEGAASLFSRLIFNGPL
jgi:hypothetical protein